MYCVVRFVLFIFVFPIMVYGYNKVIEFLDKILFVGFIAISKSSHNKYVNDKYEHI